MMHFWNIHLPSFAVALILGLAGYAVFIKIKKARQQDVRSPVADGNSYDYSAYAFGNRSSQSTIGWR